MLVPDPFLILVNKDILKEDYQNALKKLTLFFLLNPLPFNGKSYQKQKEPGTNEQLIFSL